ncbi:Homeobox-DDT domain protein RLT1 [Senna tora]|uniref:Homeobox-DDT domain protein RLT1 n=1 Tax=Senna tora TaxID=362788 RepID=A0A834SCM1_9FABA|nr:Homeobox-DDT domain protein RLT1 [Senna tora]
MLSASLFICIKTLCSTISHRCTGNGMTQRHNRLPSCNGPSMSSFLSPFPKLYPEAEESQVLGFSFTGFYEHSTGEASAYNSNKNHRVGTKHGVEGMKYDSASNHSDHYGGIARNPTDLMMHGYDNVNLTNVQRSEYVNLSLQIQSVMLVSPWRPKIEGQLLRWKRSLVEIEKQEDNMMI